MLLRKRAWDIVREDYPRLAEGDSLADAVYVLNGCMGTGCGGLCALVMDESGRLKGAVSIWDTMRFMEDTLLSGGSLHGIEEDGFDRIFHNACKVAGSTTIADIMDKDMTVVSPDEPLLMVLEAVVKKGRSYAVVKEGKRTIGVIMIHDIFKEISTDMLNAERKSTK